MSKNYWEAEPDPVATPPADNLAVQIAKDVIKQLEILRLVKGVYLSIGKAYGSNLSAQAHIEQITKRCHVCALGACMLSYVRLNNKLTIGELTALGREGIVRQMEEAFSRETLTGIERAFEMWQGTGNPYLVAAGAFGRQYPDSNDLLTPDTDTTKQRLKAIMENVIANNGEFKP